MTTIHQALQQATHSLQELPHSTPELEAAVLLCHLLDRSHSYLYAWPDKLLTTPQVEGYKCLLNRRLQGEPIAHITGIREFWSLALNVSPTTLIPRPETEQLVERALEIINDYQHPVIADLGTGCGAIALAIASERPDCTLHASDASYAALQLARENARRLKLDHIKFHHGSWFEAIPDGSFYDLIVSNPPYIPEQDPHLSQGDLPWEPDMALTSGVDGLDAIRLIVSQAINFLKPRGWLLIEHGYDQGKKVRDLYQQSGYLDIQTRQDLAGRDRITEGRYV